jgi:hypothetical protein
MQTHQTRSNADIVDDGDFPASTRCSYEICRKKSRKSGKVSPPTANRKKSPLRNQGIEIFSLELNKNIKESVRDLNESYSEI